MKISQEDVILIKNLYLSKPYGARRLLSELSDKGWKLGSIDSLSWREATRRVQLPRNQAAVDHVCHIAVKDLVLNQKDKAKKGISLLVRFPMKLPFSVQVYTEK